MTSFSLGVKYVALLRIFIFSTEQLWDEANSIAVPTVSSSCFRSQTSQEHASQPSAPSDLDLEMTVQTDKPVLVHIFAQISL